MPVNQAMAGFGNGLLLPRSYFALQSGIVASAFQHPASDSMGGPSQVVWSVEEAYTILGVRPEAFTERLFPKEMAA